MKKVILLLMLILAVFFCVYTAAEEDPLFIAQEGGKQGFINKAGEWVVQPEYACVWPFTDAGYASVEGNPWRGTFRLIDRQGNIVADLPDWYMDTIWGTDDLFHDFDLQNAAGTAFLLRSMADTDLYALYIAGADKLIKLDQAFLGYSLSPEQKSMLPIIPIPAWTEYSHGVLSWRNGMTVSFWHTNTVITSGIRTRKKV